MSFCDSVMAYAQDLEVDLPMQGTNELQAPRSASPANTMDSSHGSEEGRPRPIPISHDGLNVLGGGMREMVDLVNRLRASGIEDLGLPLPRIAVIGNQSAGKSSLIEAISGIKVPRYSGTCTRVPINCPLEITLKEANQPWSCRVSLRFKKRYNAMKAKGNPWEDQPTTEQVHFLDLTDKSQVGSALVRAQTAILNPSKAYTDFSSPEYRMNDVFSSSTAQRSSSFNGRVRQVSVQRTKLGSSNYEDLEVKFSPNVVVMEITAPEVPNLSFIDLPGVIQTTEDQAERYLIRLVENLVTEYVTKPDCLILLAVTMKDDAVNQSAARMARELGEDRTIGALTKPDTVEAGDHNQWLSILRGQSHRLRHGYFVTKQPNQDALNKGIDNATARQQETEFFQTQEPWATELSDLQHRFGTNNLANYLASELGKLIRSRLPTIIETIDGQAVAVNKALAVLPAPPSNNSVVIVERLLAAFDKELRQGITGTPGRNGFRMDLESKMEEFSTGLKGTRPRPFLLATLEEEEREWRELVKARSRVRNQGTWFDQEPQQSQHEREVTPTPSHGAPIPGTPGRSMQMGMQNLGLATPRKRQLATGEAQHRMPQSPTKRPRTGQGVPSDHPHHKYSLPRIRHIIESTSTSGLPNQIDPEAVTNLAKDTMVHWGAHTTKIGQDMAAILGKLFKSVFEAHFKRYDKSPIFERVYQILERFMKVAVVQLDESITRLCRLETSQARTLSQDDFRKLCQANEKRLEEMRRRNLEGQREAQQRAARAEQEAREAARMEVDNAAPPATPRGRGRLARPRAPSPTPEDDGEVFDPFGREIGVLAQVQAYHDIARKRFVDYIYMTVTGEFLEGIKKNILEELKAELGFDSGPDAEETCRKLLVEDPEKERRRKELLKKKAQLEKAKAELSGYLD